MGVSFDVLERGPAALYGDSGGVWVMILHTKPLAADMELARPSLKAMRDRHPDGFPTLTWVLPTAGLSMDSDARQTAARVTKAFDASIRSMATLVEGEGFGVAAVRAIIAGIDLLSRAAAPKKTFATLNDAIAWCVTLRPARDRDAGTTEEIVAAITAARNGLSATT